MYGISRAPCKVKSYKILLFIRKFSNLSIFPQTQPATGSAVNTSNYIQKAFYFLY